MPPLLDSSIPLRHHGRKRKSIPVVLPLKYWLRVQNLLVMGVLRVEALCARTRSRKQREEHEDLAREVKQSVKKFNRALYVARGGSPEEWNRIQRSIKKRLMIR
jgi:hypothetical protein